VIFQTLVNMAEDSGRSDALGAERLRVQVFIEQRSEE